MNNLILMHKDIPVANLLMSDTMQTIRINEIFNEDHMPQGTHVISTIMPQRINSWMKNRTIPSQRPNYYNLMQKCKTLTSSELSFKSYSCSLTDCYWFKNENENVKWNDVNFYTNGFDDSIGKFLINPERITIIERFNSPDITTNGALPKAWIQSNDKIFFLMKQCTDENKYAIYNEIFASKVAEKLNLDATKYFLALDKYSNKKCSLCESFIHNDNEEFVSLFQISTDRNTSGYKNAVEYMNTIGFSSELQKMMVLDYIIANNDRHLGNVGFIRNPETLIPIKMAPIFDHDQCMETKNDNITPFIDDSKLLHISHKDELRLVNDFNWINSNSLNNIPDIYKAVMQNVRDEKSINLLTAKLTDRINYLKDFMIEKNKETEMEI